MWLITVDMPENTLRFKVNSFKERDGRILFIDNQGQPKNFPADKCFIEGVR